MTLDILDGRYQLLHPLGAGGQGRVFRGRDLHTGAVVAVKILDENPSPRRPHASPKRTPRGPDPRPAPDRGPALRCVGQASLHRLRLPRRRRARDDAD